MKTAAELAKTKRYLEENVETAVRSPQLAQPDAITQAQLYLIQRAREADSPTDGYARNGWQALIPQYGEVVARAFREAAVGFWRRGRPLLVSEGAPINSTPYATIFGLMGITIESEERPDWLASLTADQAELAFRYAMHELNGFPAWLSHVAERYPDLIRDMALAEIRFELFAGRSDQDTHYLLSDLSWSGQWLWDGLGSRLLDMLAGAEPDNLNNLRYALVIVQGSPIGDDALARVAADKARSVIDLTHAAIWFAVWVGVAPGDAIPALETHLAGIAIAEEATEFTMSFVTHLIGSRFSRMVARGAYKAATYLKALYLLVSRHVRSEDDLERAGKGVYSPTIRDDAQEARNGLFSMLRELPGKEAFVAMNEIARDHADPELRRWALRHAASKAAQDANGEPWAVSQVREFVEVLERTPASHRELFDLAVLRFEDLKAELEEGDDSDAAVLLRVQDETELRSYLGGRLRRSARGRYAIPQEEELADARRPDLRFHHAPIDAPVPAELKLSHRWTLRQLSERLENQVCGSYLRDLRSSRGLLVLVHQGRQQHWELPDGSGRVDFEGVVRALEVHWASIADRYPDVSEIKILGIDLTKRGAPTPRRRGRASVGT